MTKSYEFYDIFKKSCSYENGQGKCTKTRKSKKCIDNKCEEVIVPENKKQVLEDYYKQIKETEQDGGALSNSKKGLKKGHSLLHKNKIYKCSQCYYKTTKQGNLEKHSFKMHTLKNQELLDDNLFLKRLKQKWFDIQNTFKDNDNVNEIKDNDIDKEDDNVQNGGDRKRSRVDRYGNVIKGEKIPIKKEKIKGQLLYSLSQKYKCPICNKYKYEESMTQHLDKHEKYKCHMCDQYFSKYNFDDHMYLHKNFYTDLSPVKIQRFPRHGGGGRGEPKNKQLYNSVKKAANKKFKSPSGVYRSSWIVKEYIRRGGKYTGKKDTNKGLKRWFKEKWVDLNRPIKNSKGKIIGYKSCGRKSQISTKKDKYPLCRPSKIINKNSPRTYKQISKKSINKAKKDKSKVKSSGNIQFGNGSQEGGYYGSPELKYKLLSNIKKKQSPIVQKIITKYNDRKRKIQIEDYKKKYIKKYNEKIMKKSKQKGGYYGSPKLKKTLISNLKKHECPVCKKIFKDKESHTKSHSLPPKKRYFSQIGKGECNNCGTISFARLKDDSKIQCGKCGDYCSISGGGKIRSQYKGTRSKIMVKVPENVKKAALYSYKLKKYGFRGGVETGWKRAKQLSTKSEIPIEDLKFMKAWFARHLYASYPTYHKWQKAGRPKTKEWHNRRGILSWQIWGSDAAFKWVNSQKNINLLNKHYPTKNYISNTLSHK